MKLGDLEIVISVIKGAAAALDMINSDDLAELEQTELFSNLTEHSISLIASDTSSYVNTLEQIKVLMENNGGKLPPNSPLIRQQLVKSSLIGQGRQGESSDDHDPEFSNALANVFGGYNFL